jgi:hypothetical protein
MNSTPQQNKPAKRPGKRNSKTAAKKPRYSPGTYADKLNGLSYKELLDSCKKKNLPSKGGKDHLIQQLVGYENRTKRNAHVNPEDEPVALPYVLDLPPNHRPVCLKPAVCKGECQCAACLCRGGSNRERGCYKDRKNLNNHLKRVHVAWVKRKQKVDDEAEKFEAARQQATDEAQRGKVSSVGAVVPGVEISSSYSDEEQEVTNTGDEEQEHSEKDSDSEDEQSEASDEEPWEYSDSEYEDEQSGASDEEYSEQDGRKEEQRRKRSDPKVRERAQAVASTVEYLSTIIDSKTTHCTSRCSRGCKTCVCAKRGEPCDSKCSCDNCTNDGGQQDGRRAPEFENWKDSNPFYPKETLFEQG